MFLSRDADDLKDPHKLEEDRLYALAIVRYRIPIEEVDEGYREAHRDYLRSLKKQGLLIASGPFKPHFGGAFLLRVPVQTPPRLSIRFATSICSQHTS